MSRDPEQVRLKVVEDRSGADEPVVRLKAGESFRDERAPVPLSRPGRVIPPEVPRPERPETLERLMPAETSVERRSHEPGVEMLMDGAEGDGVPLEESWTRVRNPLPWGWFVLVGGICSAAVIWSVLSLVENRAKPEVAREISVAKLEQERRTQSSAEERVETIFATIRSYMRAGTPAERLRWCRHRERVGPLMEEWYRSRPFESGAVESFTNFEAVTLEGDPSFWAVTCVLADGGMKNLLVQDNGEGGAAVDWEMDVVYQPMDWDRYATERPAGSFDFRVTVNPGSFHTHEFSDAGKWLNVTLSAKGAEKSLDGYVIRSHDTAAEIQGLIRRNQGKPTALILRISIPEGLKSPRGVVIEKVLSHHWLILTPPGA